MDDRFEQVRQMLIKQKQEILKKRRVKKVSPEKQAGGDFIDAATDNLEHELNYIFEERERDRLSNIESALNRIKQGSYGECEECGDDIELERLLALPFTKLCLDCKAKQERQKKLRLYAH